MAQSTFCTYQPLQSDDPMLLDAVPRIGRPQDMSALGVELLIQLRFIDRVFRWSVVVDPVLNPWTFQEMRRVRNRPVLVRRGKSDIADLCLSIGLVVVRGAITKKISPEQVV